MKSKIHKWQKTIKEFSAAQLFVINLNLKVAAFANCITAVANFCELYVGFDSLRLKMKKPHLNDAASTI